MSAWNPRRSTSQALRSFAALAAAAVAFAAPAAALHTYSPDSGAHVYDTNTRSRINVTDAKCDGYWVYGNWNMSTSQRLENKSGCNTNVTKDGVGIQSLRACTEKPVAPDSCSVWKGY